MNLRPLVLAFLSAAALAQPALAQISGDVVRIGFITDISGLYSDIDGSGGAGPNSGINIGSNGKGTLVLTGKGGERRWPGLPALADGSHHPDWFHKVAVRFLAAVAGESRAGANLAEAALCCEIEHLARESSRRGGVRLPLVPAPVVGSRLWGSRP